MIDLSHLTEEEQGTIMTVLRRDADLKKAEEERIGKLDKIMNSGSKMDAQWKYLTGEWFYEAKSRRHSDKIHGSEIILAAMKTNNTPFDASPRTERSKTQGSIDLDVAAPVKPARSFETLHSQMINRAGKEHHSKAVHSPRMPRQNPFNQTSWIYYEAPQNINIISTDQDKDSSETEPESPLKSRAAEEASQTSGGSTTSETSSSGFKPVPRKRTFVSRQSSTVLESSGPGLDAQVGSVVVVPAPRQRLRRDSSGSASQSHLGEDDMSQKSVDLQKLAQPYETPDENSQQPLLSNSILEREEKPPSVMRDRSLTDTMRSDTDVSTKDTGEKHDEPNDDTLRESEALNADILRIDSIQDSDRGDSVGTAGRQEELSLPQSTADPDPPVSYDLNFIDKSDGQVKKSNQKHVFKLTTQTTSPTGDEESIAKVLDWFTRSTDSSDWLRARDGSGLTSRSVKYIEGSKSKGEAEDVLREQLEKHNTEAKELSATEEIINKEVTKVQELRKDSRERMHECEDEKDERQKPHVSHLRSFWERHKLGPKILIIKSMTPRDKVENTFDPARVMVAPGLPSQPGIYNQEGTLGGERQHLVISLQGGAEDSNHELSGLMYTPASADLADRRSSDSDILHVLRHSQDLRTVIPFERSVESQGVTLIKSYREADSISQSTETALQDQLAKAATMSQPVTDLQTRDSPDPFSRNTPYVGNNQGGNDIPLTPETQTRRGRHKDKNWNSKDKRIQVSMSPKRNEDTPVRERSNSPHKNTQGLPHQEISAERIKQLKSFWEQDRKPMFYNSKPNPDWKISRGPSQAKINKRFTKSEYDLRSLENEEEDEINYQNVTVIPLNQRNDKLAPSLGTSQFNTLRDFWDEATSNTKGSFDKPKRLKRKESIGVNPASKELECGEADIHHLTMRPTVPKSPLQNQSKSALGGKFGSGATNESSKDFTREEKSTKTPPSTGKEVRPLKVRKDSFETSSSRANSMRRAASMFAVCAPEENDQPKMDAGLKLSQFRRQNGEKGATLRKSSDETGNQTPRARAYVPTDYRHYLGMTSSPSFPTSLTPTPVGKGSEGKTGYEFDLGGPVRASTPVSSEEHYSRRSSRISWRPLWTNYSSDTGQDSSLSSTSDSWSNSRNGSNYRNVDDTLHPVRKALRRAEIRPKNVTKSLEDLTAPPRRGTSQDRVADNRGISDPSPTPSPSSSPLMDRNRMRKLSTSVPMFEDGRLTDSNSDNSYHRGKLTKDNSFTNLTSSSGMSSLSGSVMTMYGGDFGNVEVQGGIQFSINYIQRLREFHIFVAQCQDLAAADLRRGRSDPYVKSYLVPDKSNLGKRKTSVKKKTLNPTFNEILRYRVHMDYLRTQMLILSVWHHDTFGRNSFLGEVDVDLSKWNFNHTQMNYLPLKARTLSKLAPSAGRGEMKLAIRYLPQITHSEGSAKAASHFYNGEIHIWVKECKNLPLIRATIDPYVKCFVLPDTSRKSRQKTRVVRRTVDPVFNHTMVYDGIRDIDLSEACVELTVWDRDRLTTNLLGGLRLGAGTGTSYGALVDWMDSTPSEVAFWERMKSKPNEWVEDTLPLRMMNPVKSSFK